MAGDWIKMRTDLNNDPAVIQISSALGIDEDAVVGKLHRAWSWADRHTTDGKTQGVTIAWLDRFLGCPGFATAMQACGWLNVAETGIEFPHFEIHNGKPAKARAEGKIRKQLSRICHKDVPEMSQQLCDKSVTREEKRREEKSESIAPAREAAPEEAKTFCIPPEGSFEAFYAAYPRKIDQEPAAREWRALGPNAALVREIMASLALQTRSREWTEEGGKFVKSPASWLRDKKWKDVLTPIARAPPVDPKAALAKQAADREARELRIAEIKKEPPVRVSSKPQGADP